MRSICVFVSMSLLVAAAPVSAVAQAMLEHAISAAGGSAAGLAGKPVSDGVGKIFKALEKQGAAAVKEPDERPTEPIILPDGETRALKPSGAAVGPPGSVPRPRGPSVARHDNPAPAANRQPAQLVWRAVEPEPEPTPQTTREELATIQNGTRRNELVAQLGRPAARVLIPEDGTLHEVYFFAGRGKHLGTVELSDGEVSRVKLEDAQP